MTTSELIEEIARTSGLPKDTVAAVLKSFTEVTLKTLKRGEPVVLISFGAFYVAKLRRATLFGVQVPQRKKVRFRISRRHEHE